MSVAPAHMLTRTQPHRPAKAQRFVAGQDLVMSRVHEFCGNARRTLALMLAAQMQGPVFWIQPAWLPERLHMEGVQRFINPGRLTFVSPRRPEDMLWAMEDVLRTGAVPLCVADIPGLPALTPIRRLHLAAETGAKEGKIAPLGVVLTPEQGGAQGVETRWELAAQAPNWALHRRRARMAPPAAWLLDRKGQILEPSVV